MLSELDPNVQATNSLSLTGVQFLYTSDALGLSPDAQEKLERVLFEAAAGAGLNGRP